MSPVIGEFAECSATVDMCRALIIQQVLCSAL